MYFNRVCIKGIIRKFDYILTNVELTYFKGVLIIGTQKKIRFKKKEWFNLSSSKTTEPIEFKYIGVVQPDDKRKKSLNYYAFKPSEIINFKSDPDTLIDFFTIKRRRVI